MNFNSWPNCLWNSSHDTLPLSQASLTHRKLGLTLWFPCPQQTLVLREHPCPTTLSPAYWSILLLFAWIAASRRLLLRSPPQHILENEDCLGSWRERFSHKPETWDQILSIREKQKQKQASSDFPVQRFCHQSHCLPPKGILPTSLATSSCP